MTALRRRGVCPGLSAPMPTGDGLLVRLMPTQPIPLDAFAAFCEAAGQHGNGTIEVSSRGSLQVRGLTPRSAPLFASAVAELGVVTHDGIAVIDAPSIHSADEGIAHVAAELRWMLANTRLVLSPKVSVIVDGDGALHLDTLSADIRLRAMGLPRECRFCLGIGGDGESATWLGSVAPKDATNAVLGLLRMIAQRGPTARAADILRAEGVEVFRSVSANLIERSSPPPQRRSTEMVGLHRACDGTIAAGIGLAFGHAHADALAEIARVAAGHGARTMRPVPDRAILLIGPAATDAVTLTAAAERLGFVVHGSDPRRRIAACPGAPACASGLIPARALAAALTPSLERLMGLTRKGIAVHISGCLKGCAHPMPTALTLIGTRSGCGLVHNGSARATPDRYIDPDNLAGEISRITAKVNEAAHG